VNDGEMALFPDRMERRHRRMQAEEAIEIDDGVPRDVDAGTHRVVRAFAVGDHDVQAVGGATLEDDDEALIFCGS
jgi:hypothetical protein